MRYKKSKSDNGQIPRPFWEAMNYFKRGLISLVIQTWFNLIITREGEVFVSA